MNARCTQSSAYCELLPTEPVRPAHRRDSEATAGSVLLPSPTHRCQVVGVTCLRLAPPSVKWGPTAPEVAVMRARRGRRWGLQGLPLPGEGSRAAVQRLRRALPFVSFAGPLHCACMSLTKGRKFSAAIDSDAFFCPVLPPFASATLIIHILDLSISPTDPRTLSHYLSFLFFILDDLC